jgi:ABC-type proline/glycine betaine transport system ATPase subunit
MLKDKTRVLVTHAIDFLHLADRIIVMKDGEIKAMGDYDEVLENDIVKEIVSIHKKNQEEKKEAFEKEDGNVDDEEDSESAETLDLGIMRKQSSMMIKLNNPEVIKQKIEKFGRGKDEDKGKILEDDDDDKTELSQEIYGRALERTGGIIFWTICGISYFFIQGWNLYRNFETKNIASE